jgi:hypothetical protein
MSGFVVNGVFILDQHGAAAAMGYDVIANQNVIRT